jgi:hypothetical protein
MNDRATHRPVPHLTSAPEAPSSETRLLAARPTLVESNTLYRLYVQIQGTGQNVRDLGFDAERREKAAIHAERLEDLAAELRNFARERG